ncbi:MAG TPA: homoserine dehydrogenase, partial [Verrucomicrobiales bacterium]|nr:homoserine dehydrogenase [Verrucomicrobiales bacterium]
SPVNAEEPDADFVDMVFQLHTCKFGLLKKTLKNIESLSCVNSRPVVFRIENLG